MMTLQGKFRILGLTLLALAFAPSSFASPTSSCANSGSPVNDSGTLLTYFTCNLYETSGSQTFSLTSLMTEGGALLSNNDAGAGYEIVINGNPTTISDNGTDLAALYNESQWDAILYWPDDQPYGGSDTVTVYWPGDFPSMSAIQTMDASLYPGLSDINFFVAATGSETVYGAGTQEVYDVYTPATVTPEPGTFTLLLSGMLGLGLLGAMRQRYCRD